MTRRLALREAFIRLKAANDQAHAPAPSYAGIAAETMSAAELLALAQDTLRAEAWADSWPST